MDKNNFDLSIILPALGLGNKITGNLALVKDFMAKSMLNTSYELIVVAAKDDVNTAAIAMQSINAFDKNQLKVLSPGAKVGKGRDVAAGFAVATGKIQLFTDGDLAIPLINIKKAYDFLQNEDKSEECGAVFGVRVAKHDNFARKFVSSVGNVVTRILFLTRLTDLQCGFKAFRQDVAKLAFKDLKTKGWAFDVEVFAKLQNANIKVHPLKITEWRNDNDHLSGENIAAASVKSLFEMIYIRFANFSLNGLLRKLHIK